MPELPEVEASRRLLAPVMAGFTIDDVLLRRRNLRTVFAPRFRGRLRGQRVEALERRAKYLLASLGSGETLVMHLGMSGSFRISAGDAHPPERPGLHDHVVFRLSSGATVLFNDPRRFGSMELVAVGSLTAHPTLSRLGPEPLSDAFDAAALARACWRRKTSLKAALMDQKVVAGLGNIYVSEALHAARLSPQRAAWTLATGTGAPGEGARRLTAAIKRVLARAIARNAGGDIYGDGRFRVYDREGGRCTHKGCGGIVVRLVQGGRSTFYCSACQR